MITHSIPRKRVIVLYIALVGSNECHLTGNMHAFKHSASCVEQVFCRLYLTLQARRRCCCREDRARGRHLPAGRQGGHSIPHTSSCVWRNKHTLSAALRRCRSCWIS